MSDFAWNSRGIHGALRTALGAEMQARAFHRRMIEAYGSRAPFPALLAGSEKRVGWLLAACRRHGAACPADTYAGTETISGVWFDDCRRAADGEAALAALHARQWPLAGAPDIAAVFERLHRQSLNRRLPLLLRAVMQAGETERMHAAHGIPPEEAYLRHGFFSDFLEKTFSVLGAGHHPFGLFAPLLRNTSPALLTGLAVGGAMAYALKRKPPSRRKEG